MRTKGYYLIAYFLFKPDNDGYRDKHYGQPQGYAQHSYTHGRARNPFLALLAEVYAFSYKKF
jgi:hypothetical protein